jgi:hypothetical protein
MSCPDGSWSLALPLPLSTALCHVPMCPCAHVPCAMWQWGSGCGCGSEPRGRWWLIREINKRHLIRGGGSDRFDEAVGYFPKFLSPHTLRSDSERQPGNPQLRAASCPTHSCASIPSMRTPRSAGLWDPGASATPNSIRSSGHIGKSAPEPPWHMNAHQTSSALAIWTMGFER